MCVCVYIYIDELSRCLEFGTSRFSILCYLRIEIVFIISHLLLNSMLRGIARAQSASECWEISISVLLKIPNFLMESVSMKLL